MVVYPKRLTFLFALSTALYLHIGTRLFAATTEWKPVTQDELKMTEVPQDPGAAAVCLFSETFTDDVMGLEHNYRRIKVLTEQGRSWGDLQIAYVKGHLEIKNLNVRTIQRDGRIAENPVAPTDAVIWRYRRIKTSVKTLALPEVSPGTIIEYQYDYAWDREYLYSHPWVVNEELFTIRATFVRHVSRSANLLFYSSRLPAGLRPQWGADGNLHLDLANVPATEAEEFMPPTAETRPRVDFYYYPGRFLPRDVEAAWKILGNEASEGVERYLAKNQGIDRLLEETVKSDDSAELELRKIYDRVQSMRNLSYIPEAEAAQFAREKLKPPENVADVIKRGYGFRGGLDLLLLALVRRAGFQAWFLDVATRDGEMFFDPRSFTIDNLPGRAVLVHTKDKDYFLDPGTPLLPFGYLPWGQTSVRALKVDVTNGGFVMTPATKPTESNVECNAKLSLDDDGTLHGTVTATYSGVEAFQRRVQAQGLDEVARHELLESEVRGWIPANAEVQLQSKPEWTRSDPTLVAEFGIQIRDWAVPSSGRLIFPQGIFSAEDRKLFVSSRRVHDLYFPYPNERRCVIQVSLPQGYRVESLPGAKKRDLVFLSYEDSVQKENGGVRISRRVAVTMTSLPVTTYDAVFAFYQDLRSLDESPIVLETEEDQGRTGRFTKFGQ